MRLCLLVGPDARATERLAQTLAANRAALSRAGALYPRSPGAVLHTRAFMAVSDRIDMLRHHRGHGTADAQARLRDGLRRTLAEEVAAAAPRLVLLAVHHWGAGLTSPEGHVALRDLLEPLLERTGAGVDIVAHVDAPSRLLAAHYARQVLDGRARGLELEFGLIGAQPRWWDAARASAPPSDPAAGLFQDVQTAPAFLDLAAWTAFWDAGFGRVDLRPGPEAARDPATALQVLCADRGVAVQLAPPSADAPRGPAQPDPSAQWLARARRYNDLLLRRLARRDLALPRQEWRKLLRGLRVDGPPLDPASLGPIDRHFQDDLARLARRCPALAPPDRTAALGDDAGPHIAAPPEPALTNGFRASQYLLADLPRIEAFRGPQHPGTAPPPHRGAVAPSASATLPPRAGHARAAARLAQRAARPARRDRRGRRGPPLPRAAARGAARGRRHAHRRLHEERGPLHRGMGGAPPGHRGRSFPDLHQRLQRRHGGDPRPPAGDGRAHAP